MTPPKIIRQSCLITNREIEEPYCTLHIISKVAATIEEAREFAEKLNYPENCYTYEIFALDYLPMEAPAMEKSIGNLEELLARASAAGISAKYTYVIDGEYDKNGNKL
jgi:hypothetical protein